MDQKLEPKDAKNCIACNASCDSTKSLLCELCTSVGYYSGDEPVPIGNIFIRFRPCSSKILILFTVVEDNSNLNKITSVRESLLIEKDSSNKVVAKGK